MTIGLSVMVMMIVSAESSSNTNYAFRRAGKTITSFPMPPNKSMNRHSPLFVCIACTKETSGQKYSY